MDATLSTTVTVASTGAPFLSLPSMVYHNLTDAGAAKSFQDLFAEYQKDAQAILGHELVTPSTEPMGLDLNLSVSFSDGTPVVNLSLNNVSYKVLHTLEHLLLDKGAAMLQWGAGYANKHKLQPADKAAINKHLKHVQIN